MRRGKYLVQHASLRCPACAYMNTQCILPNEVAGLYRNVALEDVVHLVAKFLFSKGTDVNAKDRCK